MALAGEQSKKKHKKIRNLSDTLKLRLGYAGLIT
jgi:hypothetical protein